MSQEPRTLGPLVLARPVSGSHFISRRQLSVVRFDTRVNGGEFDVLAALRRSGRRYRLTPTDLSNALMVTSGGMTKRLSALENRGLIRREPDPNDGRSTTVSLTREGKRLVEATLPEHVANEQRLLSELSNKERAELAGLLETLAVSLGDGADTRRRGAAPAGRRRRG